MAFGLEVRSPFLDYRLAEFMAKVPANLRYRGRVEKYLLKQIAKKLLPEEIVYRPKMGFAVPLKYWLKKEVAGFARDILFSSSARQRGLFCGKEVERLFALLKLGRRDVSHKLWAVLFFELWCQHWQDSKPARRWDTPQPGFVPVADRNEFKLTGR